MYITEVVLRSCVVLLVVVKKLYLGTEEREKHTFLKNINILLGFVQVMLLIYDHLQQLKMWKGGTDHKTAVV